MRLTKFLKSNKGFIFQIALNLLIISITLTWLYFGSAQHGTNVSMVVSILYSVVLIIALEIFYEKSPLLTTRVITIFTVIVIITAANIKPAGDLPHIYSVQKKEIQAELPFQHPLNWSKKYLVKNINIEDFEVYDNTSSCFLEISLIKDSKEYQQYFAEILKKDHKLEKHDVKFALQEQLKQSFRNGFCEDPTEKVPVFIKYTRTIRSN